jgi:hypothetical protein
MKPKGEKFSYNNDFFFISSVKVFLCDELVIQNNKVMTSVNVESEKHWKSKHKFD